LAFIPRLIGGGSGDGDKATIYGFVVGAVAQTSPTILEPSSRRTGSHRIERAVKVAFPGQTAAGEGRVANRFKYRACILKDYAPWPVRVFRYRNPLVLGASVRSS
jgi:hypothetical protein